jgi:hypothetical protein
MNKPRHVYRFSRPLHAEFASRAGPSADVVMSSSHIKWSDGVCSLTKEGYSSLNQLVGMNEIVLSPILSSWGRLIASSQNQVVCVTVIQPEMCSWNLLAVMNVILSPLDG